MKKSFFLYVSDIGYDMEGKRYGSDYFCYRKEKASEVAIICCLQNTGYERDV